MTPQKHDKLKWFAIGFLAALGVFVVIVGLVVSSVTPLVKIDEATGRVQLLGGFIDVPARDVIRQLSKDGAFVFGTMEGVQVVDPAIETIAIKFGAGDMRVDYVEGEEMNWNCDGAGKTTRIEQLPAQKRLIVDFSAAFVDCDVSIPIKKLSIEGTNGEVDVRRIHADVDIQLTSGQIVLDPLDGQAYVFDLKAIDGTVAEGLQSTPPPAAGVKAPSPIHVRAEVKIGSILELD